MADEACLGPLDLIVVVSEEKMYLEVPFGRLESLQMRMLVVFDGRE
jgi:hypothetical protein